MTEQLHFTLAHNLACDRGQMAVFVDVTTDLRIKHTHTHPYTQGHLTNSAFCVNLSFPPWAPLPSWWSVCSVSWPSFLQGELVSKVALELEGQEPWQSLGFCPPKYSCDHLFLLDSLPSGVWLSGVFSWMISPGYFGKINFWILGWGSFHSLSPSRRVSWLFSNALIYRTRRGETVPSDHREGGGSHLRWLWLGVWLGHACSGPPLVVVSPVPHGIQLRDGHQHFSPPRHLGGVIWGHFLPGLKKMQNRSLTKDCFSITTIGGPWLGS